MHQERAIWLIAIIGFLYFVLSIVAHINPIAWAFVSSTLLAVVLVAVMLVTLITGFRYWRASSRLWLLPSLLCILALGSFYIAVPIGKSISDSTFRKHAAEYSSIADAFKADKLRCMAACNTQREIVAVGNKPQHIREVLGMHCDDGGVMLYFLSESYVPLVHAGFLFKESGNSNCNAGMNQPERHLYLRHIAGSWYRFSDQPDL